MQRLGNLGWAAWHLATNTITWSEQVYAIFDRDPALGPIGLKELPRHVVPDDLARLGAAVKRLLRDGAPVDLPFRVTTTDGVRHLRIFAEAQTDADGTPVEVHGFFQNVTALRDIELALRESERAVLVERGMLQAERTLAARLQHALLPIPEQSLELAYLCIDVAYVPPRAGSTSAVTGTAPSNSPTGARSSSSATSPTTAWTPSPPWPSSASPPRAWPSPARRCPTY